MKLLRHLAGYLPVNIASGIAAFGGVYVFTRLLGPEEYGRYALMPSLDSFKARKTLSVNGKDYTYYSLDAAAENGLGDISRLPASLKVLLENMLRNEDGTTVTRDDITAFKTWLDNGGKVTQEIAYRPARVLMQDFTGVPAVVDLAAMRDAAEKLGADADSINPQVPVDLVIDHSVMSRTALVTGGTRGIGLAISNGLKAAGYTVAANYGGNEEAAKACEAATGIKCYKFDVSDFEAVGAGIAQIESDLGAIDIVVNNAGITWDGPFHKMSYEQWRKVIAVDLDSAFNVTRQVWEGMLHPPACI